MAPIKPTTPAAGDEKKPEETLKPAPEADKVPVDKKTLDAILTRIETLEVEGAKKDKQIEMLTEVADKGRLLRYQETQDGGAVLIREAKVAFWNDLPVIGWRKETDEVGFREGRLVVNQKTRLFLDAGKDGMKEEVVDFLYWVQNVVSKQGEVVETAQTNNGTFWTVQLKDGRKIKLDIRFINAF